MTSRHRIDRRSLLLLAARRDAVADCATCFDLRMAAGTVAALFAVAMDTIRTGYWKSSSRAANQRLPVSKISLSNAESNLGRISLNVVEKKGMRIALLIAGVGLRNPSGVDQGSN